MAALCAQPNYPNPNRETTVFVIPQGKTVALCYRKDEFKRMIKQVRNNYAPQTVDQVENYPSPVYYRVSGALGKYQLIPLDPYTTQQYLDGKITMEQLSRVNVVEKKLGQGSFGEVSVVGNQDVVTKKSSQIAESINEYMLTRYLTNTPCCVIQAYTFYMGKDTSYIISERMKSGNLYELIKLTVPIPQANVINIMYSLLYGIYFCHTSGIIHADLKPENILLNGNMERVADLGISQWYTYKRHLGTLRKIIQTITYRAPEVFMYDRNYSYPADVWSIGMIYLELIKERIPNIYGAFFKPRDYTDETIISNYARIYGINLLHGLTTQQISQLLLSRNYQSPLINDPRLSLEEQEFFRYTMCTDPNSRMSVALLLKLPLFKNATIICERCSFNELDYSESDKILLMRDFPPRPTYNYVNNVNIDTRKIDIMLHLERVLGLRQQLLIYYLSPLLDLYYTSLVAVNPDKTEYDLMVLIFITSSVLGIEYDFTDYVNQYGNGDFVKFNETMNSIFQSISIPMINKFPALYFMQLPEFNKYELDLKIAAYGVQNFTTNNVITWIQIHHGKPFEALVNKLITQQELDTMTRYYNDIVLYGRKSQQFPVVNDFPQRLMLPQPPVSNLVNPTSHLVSTPPESAISAEQQKAIFVEQILNSGFNLISLQNTKFANAQFQLEFRLSIRKYLKAILKASQLINAVNVEVKDAVLEWLMFDQTEPIENAISPRDLDLLRTLRNSIDSIFMSKEGLKNYLLRLPTEWLVEILANTK
jgi:serine/threonine protein kinase